MVIKRFRSRKRPQVLGRQASASGRKRASSCLPCTPIEEVSRLDRPATSASTAWNTVANLTSQPRVAGDGFALLSLHRQARPSRMLSSHDCYSWAGGGRGGLFPRLRWRSRIRKYTASHTTRDQDRHRQPTRGGRAETPNHLAKKRFDRSDGSTRTARAPPQRHRAEPRRLTGMFRPDRVLAERGQKQTPRQGFCFSTLDQASIKLHTTSVADGSPKSAG